jgi:hypothetical protein
MKSEPEALAYYDSWLQWIESASGSADRFADRDVVPLSMARVLAVRLEECHKTQLLLIKNMAGK